MKTIISIAHNLTVQDKVGVYLGYCCKYKANYYLNVSPAFRFTCKKSSFSALPGFLYVILSSENKRNN